MNLDIQNSWHRWLSTIINLSFAVFYWQWIPCEGLLKSRDDTDFSRSGYFTRCPPRPVSFASFFCEASRGPHPRFSVCDSVRLRPRKSLRTVLFFNIRSLSAAWPVLHVAVLCPPARLHSPNSFVKPPPRFSVCDFGHANRFGPFVFQCSLCQQHGPSSRLPSCAFPCLCHSPSPIDSGTGAFGRSLRLGINAAILPYSIARNCTSSRFQAI